MGKKKLTRRAAIGLGIGGMAAAPFIIRALKAPYAIPSRGGTHRTTVKFQGREITLDVPMDKLGTPQGQKEAEAQIMEQLENDPTFVEANEQWKEGLMKEHRKSILSEADKLEKRQLENLAKLPISEEERQAAIRNIKENKRAAVTGGLDYLTKVMRERSTGSR